MKHTKNKAAAAAAVVVAGSAIATAPAAANHPNESCIANLLCEWQDAGFSNAVKWWAADHRDMDYNNGDKYSSEPRDLNDDISAVWNNTGHWVTLAEEKSIGGHTFCLAPGMAIRDLHNVTFPPRAGSKKGTFNDLISSHQFWATFGAPPDCDKAINRDDQRGCSM